MNQAHDYEAAAHPGALKMMKALVLLTHQLRKANVVSTLVLFAKDLKIQISQRQVLHNFSEIH